MFIFQKFILYIVCKIYIEKEPYTGTLLLDCFTSQTSYQLLQGQIIN